MRHTIEKNLLRIQEEIEPSKPNIIAVTKYFDESGIIESYYAGLRNFGESRAVEAVEKINRLPEEVKSNSKFHFIGHLQTNKVKKVVQTFDFIHSIDSLKLAQVVSEEAQKIGKVQNIFLQYSNANEEQKFGFLKEELFEIIPQIQELKGVNAVGLMNMAPIFASEEELKKLFKDVVDTRNELEQKYNCKLSEISMGMSQDYGIAAREGSTYLRVGRKLFK